jgi:hypothetical protein
MSGSRMGVPASGALVGRRLPGLKPAESGEFRTLPSLGSDWVRAQAGSAPQRRLWA